MSHENGLHAYLRQKATSATGPDKEVDWNERRERWLSQVTQLYEMVHTWLTPLERDGTIQFQTSVEDFQEDYIGPYQINVLRLLVGKQRVEFHPKGTLIIGADGRIDVKGQRAIRTLVLKEGRWFIVEASPQLKTLPFNEDSFQDVLQEVME